MSRALGGVWTSGGKRMMRPCESKASRPGGQSLTQHRLKLRLYRSMGIDAEQDQHTGEYTRAVVRNPQRKDVHVLDLSETHRAGSTTGLADRVWACLPG